MMRTMPTAPFTARIETDLKAELEQIARYERRSAGFLAGQAIRNLVEERRATRELIDTGLRLVALGAPALSSEEIHAWLEGDEAAPFPRA
jgi:predicted transcriptional regulator